MELSDEQFQKEERSLKESLRLPLAFVAILWVIEVFHSLGLLEVSGLGLLPQDVSGLLGILTAPLAHADFAHLMSNSVPLILLGTAILHFYKKVALSAFVLIYLLTGTAVWLLGRGGVFHIGASGVVYGLVAFVFWTGIFTRNPVSIVLTLIVTFLYSGMFLGILPNEDGISWESHLFGGIAGAFCAFLFRSELMMMDKREGPTREEEERKRYFLDRDTFSHKVYDDEIDADFSTNKPKWVSSQTWEE